MNILSKSYNAAAAGVCITNCTTLNSLAAFMDKLEQSGKLYPSSCRTLIAGGHFLFCAICYTHVAGESKN